MGERELDSTLDPVSAISPILECEQFNDILDDKSPLALPYSPDPFVIQHLTFQHEQDNKLPHTDVAKSVEDILVSSDYEFKDAEYHRLIKTNRNNEYLEKCLSHSGRFSELELEIEPILGEMELEDVFDDQVIECDVDQKDVDDQDKHDCEDQPDVNPCVQNIVVNDPEHEEACTSTTPDPPSAHRLTPDPPHTIRIRNNSDLFDSGIGDVLGDVLDSTSPSVLDRIMSFMRNDSEGDESTSPSPVCSTPNEQGTPVSKFEFPLVPLSELVCKEQWHQLFDDDGRLIHHVDFRHYLFNFEWPTELLTEAWKFEFEFYRLDSTLRERAVLDQEYSAIFTSQLNAWKRVLEVESLGEDLRPEVALPPCSVLDNMVGIVTNRAPLIAKRIKHLAYLIDKDVPRTDRDLQFYKGKDNANMDILRDLLITYSVYHPELDYVQGMNDLLSLFLVTTKDPIVAYWCFERYLNHAKQFFVSSGMIEKLRGVYDLLAHFDTDLHDKFKALEMTNMLFCHRWLLLCFKRESVTFQVAVKIFTALNSDRSELCAKDGLSLDMFFSVAIMMKHRECLLHVTDQTQVYEWVSGLYIADMTYVVAARQMQDDYLRKRNNISV